MADGMTLVIQIECTIHLRMYDAAKTKYMIRRLTLLACFDSGGDSRSDGGEYISKRRLHLFRVPYPSDSFVSWGNDKH